MPRLASRPVVFVAAVLTANVVVPVCGVLPTAQAQTPSSYQRTCRNISISVRSRETDCSQSRPWEHCTPRPADRSATLRALCRRMDGSYNRTSIELHGIANIDGELRFTPDEPGNFQNTCQHIHVRDDILTASCRRIDGSYNNTSIPIPGITNENGDLRSNW